MESFLNSTNICVEQNFRELQQCVLEFRGYPYAKRLGFILYPRVLVRQSVLCTSTINNAALLRPFLIKLYLFFGVTKVMVVSWYGCSLTASFAYPNKVAYFSFLKQL